METEKVISLPIKKRPQEKIEHVFIELHTKYNDKDYVNIEIVVKTNIERYTTRFILPWDFMVAEFDDIFSAAKDELKQLINKSRTGESD